MREVFVDTSGFYAFLDGGDPHHAEARSCFRRAASESWVLFTTNYVLHETRAIVQARLGWKALEAWRDGLVTRCDVVWITREVHALGEARCSQARERRTSLTDGVSLEVMRARGVCEAIAWGEHFTRQGATLPR